MTEHARATGISVAALGIMFVIRAVGDVNESWLTWVSPIGWAQKIGSFGDDERWWPLGLTVLLRSPWPPPRAGSPPSATSVPVVSAARRQPARHGGSPDRSGCPFGCSVVR